MCTLVVSGGGEQVPEGHLSYVLLCISYFIVCLPAPEGVSGRCVVTWPGPSLTPQPTSQHVWRNFSEAKARSSSASDVATRRTMYLPHRGTINAALIGARHRWQGCLLRLVHQGNLIGSWAGVSFFVEIQPRLLMEVMFLSCCHRNLEKEKKQNKMYLSFFHAIYWIAMYRFAKFGWIVNLKQNVCR